jgi:hypothetical protein
MGLGPIMQRLTSKHEIGSIISSSILIWRHMTCLLESIIYFAMYSVFLSFTNDVMIFSWGFKWQELMNYE